MRDRTVEIMWQAIDALDFSRMKAKLLHQKQHAQWTPESLESAEAGYRQFLKMAAKYPGTPAVPSEQVDAFRHAHILDTRRYASDCENIFGYVLHHDPYVGIDGPEDEARLLKMAAESDALSMREFGSPLTSASCCARAAADEPALLCLRGEGGGTRLLCSNGQETLVLRAHGQGPRTRILRSRSGGQ
ncbi:glycine-rich domain-containing protein [Cupriavidus basilensis]